MDAITFRHVAHTDDLVRLRPQWDALHHAARGAVFQSFEWLSAWWRVYGNGFSLRAGTFWDGGRLVGLFPCFLVSQQSPIGRITRLRIMGEHEIYGEYRPLAHPDCGALAAPAAAFLADELRNGACDMIDFNSLPNGDAFLDEVRRHLRQMGVVARWDPFSLARMMMALPREESEYLGALGKRARHNITHDERILLRNGVRHTIVSDPADGKALAVLEHLHALGWARKGKGCGYFESRAGFGDFMRRVVPSLMETGNARIHMLTHRDRPIATTLTLTANGHCAEYIGGFDPFHPLSKFSPGKILSSLCIREAIRSGCVDFDFQGGREYYKTEVGCKLTGFSRFSAFEPRFKSLKPLLFILALHLNKLKRQFRDPFGPPLSRPARPAADAALVPKI